MKRSLTLGLRSIEIETDRGTPASMEGPEGIKCELELTLFFSRENEILGGTAKLLRSRY